MKYEVVWSDFAEKQIDDIHKFYHSKTKSLNIANRIISRILIAPDSLKHSPEIGQREPALSNRKLEYRYIVVSNYKLIYTVNKKNYTLELLIYLTQDKAQQKLNEINNREAV